MVLLNSSIKNIHHSIHLLYIINYYCYAMGWVVVILFYAVVFKLEDSWTCYLDRIHFHYELNEHNHFHPI